MSARLLVAMAIALACVSCGPTVEDICEDLQTCPDLVGADCVDDGELLEEEASDADCDDEFSDYLDCLDQSGCDWRDGCADSRDRITDCVGGLPD